MRWGVEFYEDESGKRPVEEFLERLPKSTWARFCRFYRCSKSGDRVCFSLFESGRGASPRTASSLRTRALSGSLLWRCAADLRVAACVRKTISGSAGSRVRGGNEAHLKEDITCPICSAHPLWPSALAKNDPLVLSKSDPHREQDLAQCKCMSASSSTPQACKPVIPRWRLTGGNQRRGQPGVWRRAKQAFLSSRRRSLLASKPW